MSTVNWSAIYLGNFADFDSDEADLQAEDSSPLIATFGSAANPMSNFVVNLQTVSNDGNSAIGRDNTGTPDRITYQTSPGGPTETTTVDSIFRVNTVVQFSDGPGPMSNGFFVIQDTNGNVFFLADDQSFSFGQMDSRTIDSITITGISDDNRSALNQSWVDNGPFAATGAGPTICFLPETRIATPCGEVAAGSLNVGDHIMTLDNGPQPILWVGRKHVRFHPGDEAFLPYRIKQGALGDGLPRRHLKLSKQHRLLLHGRQDEYLGPVIGFLSLNGISRMNGVREATFINFLLSRHEIIFAEGVPIESLFIGKGSLSILSSADQSAISAALGCPTIDDVSMRPARSLLTRRQTEAALKRHLSLSAA